MLIRFSLFYFAALVIENGAIERVIIGVFKRNNKHAFFSFVI